MDMVATLTNDALSATLNQLAAGEREATAALIAHLGEFDARRLYEPAGFSSMFTYCLVILKLSEDATYNRIEAARAVRRCPALLDMLASGALSLTTARMLARHLTPENQADLLPAAAGKGKDELEELLADRSPRPDVPASLRKVPERGQSPASAVSCADGALMVKAGPSSGTGPLTAGRAEAGPDTESKAPPAGRAQERVRPLGSERYEVRFTATAAAREKLRRAQDLLGHSVPSGDLAAVFERALDALIGALERQKLGATSRPRSEATAERPGRPSNERSRHVPAAVRRAVAARDQGRCAFVAGDGRRCDAQRFLEFHHVVPYAAGGPAIADNIQLRCRAHNGHEVDLFFGPGVRWSGAAAQRTRSGTS
jgi:hypothetical protein